MCIRDSYIETECTDYAIMINGEWGCGKSYYVKNELKQLVETIRYEHQPNEGIAKVKDFFSGLLSQKKYRGLQKNTKYQLVRVSLYGVSSPIDFYQRVFVGIYPWLDSTIWTCVVIPALQYKGINITNKAKKNIIGSSL